MADAIRFPVWRQAILASYWFGINFLWGAFLGVIIPFLLVPEHPGAGNPSLVPADQKNTWLGVLETVGVVIAFVVQPAAGAWSDRLRTRWGRRRPLIAVGAAGAALSLVLIANAQLFLMLMLGYCLLQFCMNVSQGGYQGLLPDVVPGEQRGEASGFLGVASLAGTVVGFGAAVIPGRIYCYVTAAVIAITALIVVSTTREKALPPVARSSGTAKTGWWSGLRGYLAEFKRYPDFCWVVAARFLTFTGLACIQRFAANYVRDAYFPDEQHHSYSYTVFGVHLTSAQLATTALLGTVIGFGLLATFPAVKISNRVGRRRVLVAAGVSGALGSALFFFASSLPMVLVSGIPIGIAYGMLVSVDWAYMADLAPRSRAGKFLGFSNIAATGAQAFAPALLGPIIDVADRGGGTTGYRFLFATSVVFFVIGAAVLSKVRAHRIVEADEEIGAPLIAEPVGA